QYVPTTGSILVLNFAEVIQLTEEFYAPGSLGSFNLQLQVTVENNQNKTWLGSDYELVIMVMNSGVFVNERGTSSTFIGLLTKQDVLDALQQQPYNSNEVRRMVGGGF
ncbi:MAG: major capsid protein V20 domain-containing protein, partial [Candidatus Fonsibacter sp.]